MANEITITASMKVANGNLDESWRKANLKVNQTGKSAAGSVQEIGFAAHEQIVLTDIGTAGYAYFRNTDTTNYVEVGVDVGATFYAFMKLKPGEAAVLRLATGTIYAQANTAAVKLQSRVLEE